LKRLTRNNRAVIDWRRDEDPEVLFVGEIGHRRDVYD
jgi:mRNA interferase RelE/StbE